MLHFSFLHNNNDLVILQELKPGLSGYAASQLKHSFIYQVRAQQKINPTYLKVLQTYRNIFG